MFWLRLKQFKRLFRGTTYLIVVQFVASHAVWAQPQAGFQITPPILLSKDILSLTVPESYGNIKQTYLGNSGKIIIHVQDSHVNYQAQTNIAEILKHLVRELTEQGNGARPIIAIEGAASASDPEWFRLFPNEALKKKVLDYYLKQGYISGAQFFQVFSEEPISVVGVEDPKLYLENLNYFRETYTHNKKILAHIEGLRTALLAIRQSAFNKDLLLLSQKSDAFHQNELPLTDTISFLVEMGAKHQVNLQPWPQLLTAHQAIGLEKKIDYDQVNKERDKLIIRLKEKLPQEEVAELVTQALYFRLGKSSSLDFYTYLEEAARSAQIQTELFPQLLQYIEALYTHQQIDGEQLYNQLVGAEQALKQALFKTDVEKTCSELLRRLQILEHLAKLELSRDELKEYRQNPYAFMAEEFLFFIEEQLETLKLNVRIQPNADEINHYFSTLEGFYRTALARDQALMQNTLKALEKEKAQVAILVTGGFHTEGMVPLFEKENISTMVIAPRITEDFGNAPYLNAMLNERLPLTRVLNHKGNRISQPIVTFTQAPINGNLKEQFELHSELLMLYLATMALNSKIATATDLDKFKNGELLTTVLKGLPSEKSEAVKELFNSIQKVNGLAEDERNDGLVVEFVHQGEAITVSVANRKGADQLVQQLRLLFNASAEKGVMGEEMTFMIANKETTDSLLGERKEVTTLARHPTGKKEEPTVVATITRRPNVHDRLKQEAKETIPLTEAEKFIVTIVKKDRQLAENLNIQNLSETVKKIKNKEPLAPDDEAALNLFLTNVNQNRETLFELLDAGSKYPFSPELNTLDKALAEIAHKMDGIAQLQENDEVTIFELTEFFSKVTNLKELNSKKTKDEATETMAKGFTKTSGTVSTEIKKSFKQIQESSGMGRFSLETKASFGAFQKFMLGLKFYPSLISKRHPLLTEAPEIFNKNGLTVYEVPALSQDTQNIQSALRRGEEVSEAKLTSEVRRLVIRMEGKPNPDVISEFLAGQFRDLTVFSRYQETFQPKRGANELPLVTETSFSDIEKYVQRQFQKIDSYINEGTPLKAEAVYAEMADVLGSFRLTETLQLISVRQMKTALDQTLSFANDPTKTKEEKFATILKLNELIRSARREAFGLSHPKFKAAMGEALFVHDVKSRFNEQGGKDLYLGDGDGHKVGVYNVEQTVIELKKYKAALDRGEKHSFNDFFYNTGNQRDEQLGTFVKIYSHPETAAHVISKLSDAEFDLLQKNFVSLGKRLREDVKAGRLALPPPLLAQFIAIGRSPSKEVFAKAIGVYAKSLTQAGYKGYARGGDELALLSKEPTKTALLGMLVELLNRRVIDGQEINFAGGVGFVKIKSGDTFETVSKKNAAALKLTKLLKDHPAELAPLEKYAYVYGQPLSPHVAELVIKGAVDQVNTAKSSTDLEKLQDLAKKEDNAMWQAAFFNVNQKQRDSWKNIQTRLKKINQKFESVITQKNVSYVVAQLRLQVTIKKQEALAHYFFLIQQNSQQNNILKNFLLQSKNPKDQELYQKLLSLEKETPVTSKAVLLPVYRFSEKVIAPVVNAFRITALTKEKIEDFVVPLVEEVPLITILLLAGPVPYLVARALFVLGHISWLATASEISRKTAIPLTISALASLPLLLNTVWLAVTLSALVGIFSHVGLNFMITKTGGVFSKANLETAKTQKLTKKELKPGKLIYNAESIQNKGKSEKNEDAFFVHSFENGITIAGVFDGVGGGDAGEEASKLAKETFEKQLKALEKMTGTLNLQVAEALLKSIFTDAANKIIDAAEKDSKKASMNTTATVGISFVDDSGKRQLLVGNTGDSRAYIFRNQDKSLKQLTVDDGAVGMLAERWKKNGYLNETLFLNLIQMSEPEDAIAVFNSITDKKAFSEMGNLIVKINYGTYFGSKLGEKTLPELAQRLILRFSTASQKESLTLLNEVNRLKAGLTKTQDDKEKSAFFTELQKLTLRVLNNILKREKKEVIAKVLGENYFALRNVIQNSLRQSNTKGVRFFTEALQPEDRWILTSDGVHDNLSFDKISEKLKNTDPGEGGPALAKATRTLLDQDPTKKEDDVTAVEIVNRMSKTPTLDKEEKDLVRLFTEKKTKREDAEFDAFANALKKMILKNKSGTRRIINELTEKTKDTYEATGGSYIMGAQSMIEVQKYDSVTSKEPYSSYLFEGLPADEYYPMPNSAFAVWGGDYEKNPDEQFWKSHVTSTLRPPLDKEIVLAISNYLRSNNVQHKILRPRNIGQPSQKGRGIRQSLKLITLYPKDEKTAIELSAQIEILIERLIKRGHGKPIDGEKRVNSEKGGYVHFRYATLREDGFFIGPKGTEDEGKRYRENRSEYFNPPWEKEEFAGRVQARYKELIQLEKKPTQEQILYQQFIDDLQKSNFTARMDAVLKRENENRQQQRIEILAELDQYIERLQTTNKETNFATINDLLSKIRFDKENFLKNLAQFEEKNIDALTDLELDNKFLREFREGNFQERMEESFALPPETREPAVKKIVAELQQYTKRVELAAAKNVRFVSHSYHLRQAAILQRKAEENLTPLRRKAEEAKQREQDFNKKIESLNKLLDDALATKVIPFLELKKLAQQEKREFEQTKAHVKKNNLQTDSWHNFIKRREEKRGRLEERIQEWEKSLKKEIETLTKELNKFQDQTRWFFVKQDPTAPDGFFWQTRQTRLDLSRTLKKEVEKTQETLNKKQRELGEKEITSDSIKEISRYVQSLEKSKLQKAQAAPLAPFEETAYDLIPEDVAPLSFRLAKVEDLEGLTQRMVNRLEKIQKVLSIKPTLPTYQNELLLMRQFFTALSKPSPAITKKQQSHMKNIYREHQGTAFYVDVTTGNFLSAVKTRTMAHKLTQQRFRRLLLNGIQYPNQSRNAFEQIRWIDRALRYAQQQPQSQRQISAFKNQRQELMKVRTVFEQIQKLSERYRQIQKSLNDPTAPLEQIKEQQNLFLKSIPPISRSLKSIDKNILRERGKDQTGREVQVNYAQETQRRIAQLKDQIHNRLTTHFLPAKVSEFKAAREIEREAKQEKVSPPPAPKNWIVQVKEAQALLKEVMADMKPNIYDSFKNVLLRTPSEGELQKNPTAYYDYVIDTGIYSDLANLILSVSADDIQDSDLKKRMITQQELIREKQRTDTQRRVDTLKVLATEEPVLYYDGNILFNKRAEAQIPGMVLALDADHFPLTEEGALNLDQLHPDIKKLLLSSGSTLRIILFSVSDEGGAIIARVKKALVEQKFNLKNIETVFSQHKLDETSGSKEINTFVTRILFKANTVFKATPDSVIFLTTAANHKNLFSRALQEFLLYLVADPGESTYYVDQELAESYQKTTGDALPAKLNFVPQMRYDHNSIENFKREKATERAA